MAGRRFDKQAIEEQLRARALSLAVSLCPPVRGGFRNGNNYFPVSPWRRDNHPGSLTIDVSRDKGGLWHDYATGEKGDAFELIAKANGWDTRSDFVKVMGWAADWLGTNPVLPDLPTHGYSGGGSKADRTKLVKGIWLSGQQNLVGTLAEIYLRDVRKISLSELTRPAGSVRFDPKCRYYTGKDEYTEHPALSSLMINERLKAVGLHRTYLRDDGLGKLDVKDAKKMLGLSAGAFIPISRGESDMRLRDAMETGIWEKLAITEGIEDGYSVALARPDWRVWAAGTLGNIGELPWLDFADEIHICAQNDENLQAVKSLTKSRDKLARKANGRRLYVHRPPAHIKDWNDWLRLQLGKF